jgi:flagellar biosynthesis/type III secretory pathway protein FliH
VRRVFWLAVGLGAGATAAALAGRWMRRQTERVAPSNLARAAGASIRDLGARVAEAAREFREAAAEREAELRARLEEARAAGSEEGNAAGGEEANDG